MNSDNKSFDDALADLGFFDDNSVDQENKKKLEKQFEQLKNESKKRKLQKKQQSNDDVEDLLNDFLEDKKNEDEDNNLLIDFLDDEENNDETKELFDEWDTDELEINKKSSINATSVARVVTKSQNTDSDEVSCIKSIIKSSPILLSFYPTCIISEDEFMQRGKKLFSTHLAKIKSTLELCSEPSLPHSRKINEIRKLTIIPATSDILNRIVFLGRLKNLREKEDFSTLKKTLEPILLFHGDKICLLFNRDETLMQLALDGVDMFEQNLDFVLREKFQDKKKTKII